MSAFNVNSPDGINPTTIKPQTITIDDPKELYRCFMPFIKGGGLFIPFNQDVTPEKISPGQKIFVIFTFLKNNKKTPIPGIVIWIQPTGKLMGYGIQFPDNPAMKSLVDNIKEVTNEFALKREPTYTM